MKHFVLSLLAYLCCVINLQGQTNPTKEENNIPHYSDSIFISKIHIECNRKTIDKIIFRELFIKEGMTVCRRNLDSLLERESYKLMNTKLFILAEVVPYHVKGDTTELIISVIEKWYLYPVPIIDFADKNFSEWAAKGYDLDRLNYGISFIQNNFRGRNETLKLYLQLGFTRIVDFEYKIPYINKKQTTGINIKVSYANSKNSIYGLSNGIRQSYKSENILEEKFKFLIGISKRGAFYETHRINIGYTTSTVNDTLLILNSNYYQNSQKTQRFTQLNYSFERDLRNNIVYTHKGSYLQIDVMQKGLSGFDDISVSQAQFIYAKFIPISKKFYYSASLRGMISFPEQQPFNELRGYGFAGNFTRGMDLYMVAGQHFGVWKNTLRFKMFSKIFNFKNLFNIEQFSTFPLAIYPKIYADAGYVYSKYDYGSNIFSNQLLWGSGAGIDLVFYNSTVIRLEYSVNKSLETGFFVNIQTDF
jgi:outer membrane protein assembly factor BamA